MDNQQATQEISQVEKGWFCGIVDGEGCISMSFERRKEFKKGYRYRPYIEINNTSAEIIWKCVDILQRIGINPKVSVYQSLQSTKKPFHRCGIYLFSHLKKLLDYFSEDLVCKKASALLMLRYVNSRLTKNKNEPYSDEEIAIGEKVRSLTSRGVPNDYVSPLPQGERYSLLLRESVS